MTWDRSRPGTSAKYRTPEHRAQRRYWKPIVEAGNAECAEPVCVMPSRWIAPGSEWHVCHDETGTRYIGPGHRDCNVREAAKRARAKQVGGGTPSRLAL